LGLGNRNLRNWQLTWQNVLPERRLHADEAARVAKTASAEGLVGGGGVAVEGQGGAAGGEWHAEGVAGEDERLAAAAQLTALDVVQGVDLKRKNSAPQAKVVKVSEVEL